MFIVRYRRTGLDSSFLVDCEELPKAMNTREPLGRPLLSFNHTLRFARHSVARQTIPDLER